MVTGAQPRVLRAAPPEAHEVRELLVVEVFSSGVEHRPRLLRCLVAHGAQAVPVAYSTSNDASTSVMIVRLYARWARVDSSRAPVWERVSFQPSR
jgi:hypothetical protein